MAAAATGNQSAEIKIAIVGGGICGLVLAVAMLRRGLRVDIYEQAHRFEEIGAGVAFGPNATKALYACHPLLLEAFNNVATRNQSPGKQKIWFDWLDAFNDENGKEAWCFSLDNELGANSVHRAHFLAEVVKLLPEGIANFGKRLENIVEAPNGQLTMTFGDGSLATADAIIGCDGIKSRTRQLIFGLGHPSVSPVYTHKYAYRGLIPMSNASNALGDEVARNAHVHMGRDGHVLTFPVNHGEVMNVVAFRTKPDDWPDYQRLVLPSTRAAAQADFTDFGPSVQAILNLLPNELDRWAIFDLGDHPLPTYFKGRVCLVGDSAHASSPHHGAGAGLGVEDAAVIAELLESAVRGSISAPGGTIAKNIEAAFKAFDENRRERTQWLVQSSRRVGDLYEWRAEGVGGDISSIQKELQWRCNKIWNADIPGLIKAAKGSLHLSSVPSKI